MKKIGWLLLPLALSPVASLAHQAYLAPLTHLTEHKQVIIHAGYTEDLFVPEFALKAKFSITNPKAEKTDLVESGTFKSATILEADLPEKGTYKIVGVSERDTNYAQQGGIWKAVYDEPADKAPAANQRDWLLPREVKANDQKLVSKNYSQVVTYVSRDEVSNQALAIANSGIELKFNQHPNQIDHKNGLKFTVLFNGKPARGIKFQLHAAGEEHADDEHDKEQIGFVSNDQGEVSIPLTQAGKYLINSQYPQGKAGEKPATAIYHYVLSVEAK